MSHDIRESGFPVCCRGTFPWSITPVRQAAATAGSVTASAGGGDIVTLAVDVVGGVILQAGKLWQCWSVQSC